MGLDERLKQWILQLRASPACRMTWGWGEGLEEETRSLKCAATNGTKWTAFVLYQRHESILNQSTLHQSKTFSHSINPIPMHITPDFFPYGFYSPRTFTLSSILPTLSFCAEPKGEVAESIIHKITLVLRERGYRRRRWVRACQKHFPPPPHKFPSLTRCRCLSWSLILENWS